MAMRLKVNAAMALAVVMAGGVSASQALAQRTITDNEAGKLTLSALTATPVVHHHVTHAGHHRVTASVHHVVYKHSTHSAGHATHTLVHGSVYHGHHARSRHHG